MTRPILTVLAGALMAAGLAAPAASASLDGKKLFKRKCGACHVITEKKKLGPALLASSDGRREHSSRLIIPAL
jgi:cytochrome c2